MHQHRSRSCRGLRQSGEVDPRAGLLQIDINAQAKVESLLPKKTEYEGAKGNDPCNGHGLPYRKRMSKRMRCVLWCFKGKPGRYRQRLEEKKDREQETRLSAAVSGSFPTANHALFSGGSQTLAMP
jgi:hypothetical protein